ncbi:MAG TPA: HEPN domain-containing protein [Candidatus Paceibacterota bacterium]|nr:HEPN domain-containing protein [Candidatus Paceibacterota bacterium]
MKGYLAFCDRPMDRTHDLERLLELATALEPKFAPLETQAHVLNPYATAFRYPDTLGVHFPSVAEVRTALEHAQAIYDFVLNLIPREAWPG